jgi:hypothetical protein
MALDKNVAALLSRAFAPAFAVGDHLASSDVNTMTMPFKLLRSMPAVAILLLLSSAACSSIPNSRATPNGALSEAGANAGTAGTNVMRAGTGGSKASASASKPDAGGANAGAIAVNAADGSANAGATAVKAGAGGANAGASAPKAGVGGAIAADGGAIAADGGAVAGSAGARAGAGGSGAVAGSSSDAGAGLPVQLGAAANYVILAKSGISTVPTAAITGNLGISPAAASYITGFSLIADATNVFATSAQVTGKVFAADYAVPTPSNMTTAVSDMELAFTDAAGRAPTVTELGAGDIGGMTLASGVYKWSTGLQLPKDVTFEGGPTALWILQIAKDLSLSSATHIVLSGGALPKNIVWQVEGKVVVGSMAHLEGVVLTRTAVTLGTGASIHGRLLAQTAVVIDSSTIVEPAQ